MDFNRVEHPVFHPGVCLCGSADGPLIDTRMEKPAVGRVYLCHRCVHTAERALGGLDPKQRGELEEQLDDALAEVAMLKQEIAAEKDNKVVPLADVLNILREQSQSSTIGPTVRSM